jgi:hypothetical protein
VLHFGQYQKDLEEINICDSSVLIDTDHVLSVLRDFKETFNKLNALLLWYVDNKWCSFPSLLEEYGVHLPEKIQVFINYRVSFPDQDGQHSMQKLGTPIPLCADRNFKLDSEISCRLHKDVTYNELLDVVNEIKCFLQPVSKYRQVLVLFKNEGTLFHKYLQNYLDCQTSPDDSPMEFTSISSFSAIPPMSPIQQEKPQGTSMDTFINGVEHASKLIVRVMSGYATYLEITAGDERMLEGLDIEREFAILSKYADLTGSDFSGGSGVQSILELPQYTKHCKNIIEVCKQYNLRACLKDPTLIELQTIMEECSSIEARSNMTPNEAMAKMEKVKEILCLTGKSSSKYLNIFAAMKDSAPFYQFAKEKNFHGEQGQAIFLQQYQLITAQLQHEDYDEQVLNQLKPAFKVISPFMNSQQNFTELMTAVTNLANPVDNLKYLETVNANVMTIQKWFSRAEV